MSDVVARLYPGSLALLRAQQAELPQKDGLCGAFWALAVLRAFGHGSAGQVPLDQDGVAERAGITLTPVGQAAPRPPEEPANDGYRVVLHRAPGAQRAGASPSGLARAIGELAGGRLAVVPVSGPWEPGRLRRLLEQLGEGRAQVACLANVTTGRLWGSHPSPSQVLDYLLDGDPGGGPPAEWGVGHFVALLGLVVGRSGTFVVVADAYRSLGRDGVHLQPVERLAGALAGRGADGPARGLLLVAVDDARDKLRRLVAEGGLDEGFWDNGSLDASEVGPPSEGTGR